MARKPKKKRKPTRSQINRERWIRGRLGYKLHAGQLRLKEGFVAKSRGQIFVNECGRQFGKSYFWVLTAIELAIKKPKAKIKFGTAFHTDLVEFILPAFEAVLEDCPQDLLPKYKSQRSKYVFANGSEIKLIGIDRKPNGMRGTGIDLIVIDEAGFTDKLDYLYKSVIIPATTHRPDCRVVMSSTPPSTPAHDFLDFVQKAELEGAYIKMTIYDNPMVNQATIDRLMYESGGAHSTTWRREYLCEHITDADLAIVAEWNEKYVEEVPKDAYYPFYHKYDGMDLGVKDHTAVIFGYYEYLKGRLVIEDEYIVNGPELTTESLQIIIKDMEMRLWLPGYLSPIQDKKKVSTIEFEQVNGIWEYQKPKVFLRVSDNNNPLLLQDLSYLHRLHFTSTDKGRLEEMVNTLKIMVRSGGIIVHPRCKQLTGCLKYGVWDKNREKFAKSKVYGHFDALAALIYLVRNLNRATNPIPHDFQVDRDNQLLLSIKRDTQSVKTLKDAFGMRSR